MRAACLAAAVAAACTVWGAVAKSSFYISRDTAPTPFDLSELGTREEGEKDTLEYKLFFTYEGRTISPWHEIPYSAGVRDGEKLLHFVCEIPKGTTAKMEINKEYEFNPIIQDTKKGKLRYYKYNPEVGSLVNYGAIAQTWEHPDEEHPDTGAGGDNDPIDVLQLNDEPCRTGDVMAVRVLGVFALVDAGETDWKVLAVRADDPLTAHMRDVDDVPAETQQELVEWFRRYKTAEGKGLNTFGLDEKVMNKEYALKVCEETHNHWWQMRHGGLVNLILPEAERARAEAMAERLPVLLMSDEEADWLEVISEGWASPLDGFMTEKQYLQSLHYEHLIVDGRWVPMPVPITLTCNEADKKRIEGAEYIALKEQHPSLQIVAIMERPEIYEHRREERSGRTFGITYPGHPVIRKTLESGSFLVGGRVKVFKPQIYNDGLDQYRLTPAALREKFRELGADAVFAFQLRNPVHNGHALLMQETAARLKAAGYKRPVLWLSPVGGWTKEDDVPLKTRMDQHLAIIKNGIFGDTPVVLAIFPSPMLYAGPREVQWHAYARLNGGATHYIVGRDPAGIKNPEAWRGKSEDLYSMWHGQKMLQLSPGLRRLQLLPFTFAAYDKKAKKMAFFDPARKDDFESISGTQMQKMALDGIRPPDGFMDPEGWDILERYFKWRDGINKHTGLPL